MTSDPETHCSMSKAESENYPRFGYLSRHTLLSYNNFPFIIKSHHIRKCAFLFFVILLNTSPPSFRKHEHESCFSFKKKLYFLLVDADHMMIDNNEMLL